MTTSLQLFFEVDLYWLIDRLIGKETHQWQFFPRPIGIMPRSRFKSSTL
jgi:hypothetical protein